MQMLFYYVFFYGEVACKDNPSHQYVPLQAIPKTQCVPATGLAYSSGILSFFSMLEMDNWVIPVLGLRSKNGFGSLA